VSDREEAPALTRAREAGIAGLVSPWGPDRDESSLALADAVEGAGAKGVVLAGFMRILSSSFIDRFPNRILNIHPSLLPAFPGARAVENALAHAVKLTGVTVHFVDEEVDNGPIVAQAPVEVFADDTVATLHRRIQIEEHRLYPPIVEAFVGGRLEVVGRTVVFR
jgi:phosphoribosylglycinamide formyltransferase-1